MLESTPASRNDAKPCSVDQTATAFVLDHIKTCCSGLQAKLARARQAAAGKDVLLDEIGEWAGQAPDLYAKLGSTDLMHLAGGGILGHPDGIAAGVASMREGWEAAQYRAVETCPFRQ